MLAGAYEELSVSDLRREIDFYKLNENMFRKTHMNDWVLISEKEVLGFFSSFEEAAAKLEAEYDDKLPERPFLLRRIGAQQPVINRMAFASV